MIPTYIPNDQSDDAVLLPQGVYLSWVPIAFHNTALLMTWPLSDVVFSHKQDSLYNRTRNMTRNNISEIYQKLDCVTVRFPEAVFVSNVPESLYIV